MQIKLILILSICLLAIKVFADNNNDSLLKQKQCYYNAKTEIENMLSGKTPLSYEKAIFIMENAYFNNEIDYDLYKRTIDFYTNNIKLLAEANRNEKAQDYKQKYLEVTTEEQKRDRYNKLLYNWAIYTFITDTTFVIDSNYIYYHLPYDYSYNDPMATINWENSQVLNLFYKRKANCFALASLYKIFADRLNTDANLGLAPGHIFITHNDVKDITYNVELASRAFPGAGSIMTLTYSTIDAVKSGIAMRTLDLKQSVALCLVYLAKGYENKFNTKTDNFLYQCAETTLRYDSLNLNAMLLKAEVLEESILSTKKTIAQLQTNKQFKEYEKLITKLYVQGYLEMPLDMKNIIINQLQKDTMGFILINHTAKGFQSINPKDDRHASLSWGMFDEEQSLKLIEQYRRVMFDTKTKKITKFVDINKLYNQYDFDPVVVAWCVDPLTKKMPNWSPYASFGDNPIMLLDNEGKFPISVHQQLVENAISGLKLNLVNHLKILFGAGIRADIIHMTNNSIHLDNQKDFTSITNTYNASITKFNESINKKDYASAGEALHTIADFYSHSNYIDIYKRYCIATSKKPDISNIPTFSEALKDPKLAEMMKNELYTDVSYGGLKDKLKSNDPHAHVNMNLDEKGKAGDLDPNGNPNIYSGKETYYDAALSTAQKDIKNVVNNNQVQNQPSASTDASSTKPSE